MARLRVRFSGLFLFARHYEDEEMTKFLGVSALAVDARAPAARRRETLTQAGNKHYDGERLVPHAGYARLPAQFVEGLHGLVARPFDENSPSFPVPHDLILGLDRHQIRFEGIRNSGPLEFGGAHPPEAHGPGPYLPNVLDHEHVTGLRIDRRCFDEVPFDMVLSRMGMNTGTIEAPTELLGEWRTPATLSPTEGEYFERQTLSGALDWVVDLEDDKVTMVLSPFESGPESRVTLSTDSEEEIVVFLGNRCATNPLEWGGVYGARPDRDNASVPRRPHDDDFRWYYFLLEGSQDRATELAKQGLKLPVPEAVGGGAGIWVECMVAAAVIIVILIL